MTTVRNVVILGSTGSIGVSTLDVIARHPSRFKVLALTAHRQIDRLYEQIVAFRPQYAVVVDAQAAKQLEARLREAGMRTAVLSGEKSLEEVAVHPDAHFVMAAIVGIAGLRSTLAAVVAGKRVLLANKEALVTAGPVFMTAVRRHGAALIPIDSEHNAIFQSLPAHFDGDLAAGGVRRIVLTASGGPFRETPLAMLEGVTPAQACAHPNWVMGRKISVDSATMMNKGLEVIEASWLFNARDEQIDVVIHPESVIHSMVEYVDGSVIAQLGNPDMRTPIAHALGFPQRIEAGVSYLDLAATGSLHFAKPDESRFPCLRLARTALRAAGSAPALLNAANEVAVAAFLEERIGYLQIAALLEDVLSVVECNALRELDDVFEADQAGRAAADAWIARHAARTAKRMSA
jgi:1-deoxy-D-xylulose-5-phosphate reductoisomerase